MTVHTHEFGSKTALIYPSRDDALASVTAAMLKRTAQLLDKQNRVDIALTGGTDGIALLKLARTVVDGKDSGDSLSCLVASLDFSRIHFWWGDERFVPQNDQNRNALQARKALLDNLTNHHGLPEANIHEMPAEPRDPEKIQADRNDTDANLAVLKTAASTYQDELLNQLGDKGHLDIALFGMGPDGHFASLFPGYPQIFVQDNNTLVLPVVDSPKLPPLRLTLTAPFIQSTPYVWVVTTGTSKATAAARALREPNNGDFPSSFAQGTEETLWFLDKDSACELS